MMASSHITRSQSHRLTILFHSALQDLNMFATMASASPSIVIAGPFFMSFKADGVTDIHAFAVSLHFEQKRLTHAFNPHFSEHTSFSP